MEGTGANVCRLMRLLFNGTTAKDSLGRACMLEASHFKLFIRCNANAQYRRGNQISDVKYVSGDQSVSVFIATKSLCKRGILMHVGERFDIGVANFVVSVPQR